MLHTCARVFPSLCCTECWTHTLPQRPGVFGVAEIPKSDVCLDSFSFCSYPPKALTVTLLHANSKGFTPQKACAVLMGLGITTAPAFHCLCTHVIQVCYQSLAQTKGHDAYGYERLRVC